MGSISAAGSLFLLWLAWDCIHGAGVDPNAPTNDAPKSIKKALLTNALNPHPYLFWFAVGGPLVADAWSQNGWCVAGFLMSFFACLVGSKMGIALLTHSLGGFMRGRIYRFIMWALGGAIVLCSVYFAIEAIKHFGINLPVL